MSQISITDLEVHFRVGVPDEERVTPQRLLLSANLEFDFAAAAAADDLTKTINYYDVTQELLRFGDGRSWKLIEKLAVDIADLILKKFPATAVTVTVKKFVIPEAAHVAVTFTRHRTH
jgi:dihydroneopterin aldolase